LVSVDADNFVFALCLMDKIAFAYASEGYLCNGFKCDLQKDSRAVL